MDIPKPPKWSSNSCNDAPDWASLNSFQALPDFGRLVHASVFSTARTWVLLQAMTNVGSMQTAVAPRVDGTNPN